MPPVSVAAAMAESSFLEAAAVDIEPDILKQRVEPIFDVFTQHLSGRKKQEVLERVVNSLYVIGENHVATDGFAGLHGHPAAYKRAAGVIEVAEPKFHEKGYLEWALVLKLGDMNFFRIIPHYKIAADAVASFYMDDLSHHGLPRDSDARRLWVAKHLIPIELQGRGTREMAYRFGNLAKEKNHGLQFIYGLTR